MDFGSLNWNKMWMGFKSLIHLSDLKQIELGWKLDQIRILDFFAQA